MLYSSAISIWLMDCIQRWVGRETALDEVVYVAVVVLASFAIGRLVKWLFIFFARKVFKISQHILVKCAHIVPPAVFLALMPMAFDGESRILLFLERLVWLYALAAVGIGVSAVLTFLFNRYNERSNTRNLPLKGVLNIAKGSMWVILIVIAVSIWSDRTPAALLTGLGAFAAALMLIFKDSILGFIAGLQMSQNDMLHVGDWIVVPSTPANGIVIDVSLSAVKVQNFDNTIVTVPPYTLISTSFRNYRGMYESGIRLIEDNITVDVQSVCRTTDALMTDVCEKYPLLKDTAEGTRDTNVGLFRLYAMAYLRNRPDIAKDQRLRVYFDEFTAKGMQIMVYCYVTATDWNTYETTRSAVMEHLCVAAADFGLTVYNSNNLDVKMR